MSTSNYEHSFHIDDAHGVPEVDYESSGCPVCGETTPPSEHTKCFRQLGEWPAKGERYNDDV